MYSDTVTIFNRYESRLGDMWYPTVLHDVNVMADRSAIVQKYGEESKDNAVLNVRYDAGDMIAGKAISLQKHGIDRQMIFCHRQSHLHRVRNSISFMWGNGRKIPLRMMTMRTDFTIT